MATIKTIRNADGSVSYGAHVRVRPFKPVWKSFATKTEASHWLDDLTRELKKQREQGSPRPDLATLTLADLNKAFLEDPVTQGLRYYERELKRHLLWWTRHYGNIKVIEFGVVLAREARTALMPGRAAATVDRSLAAQRRAWNWGREAGYVSKDHLWPPGLMLPEPDARWRYLSAEELPALLQAAEARSPVLHAAIVVAIATGVRKGELLRLRWSDVDFERQCVSVLITKNGQPRSVHLPASAVAALQGLKAAPVVSPAHVFLSASGKPMTWQALDKLWRGARTAAGLKDFRWHDLRHSCASYLAQAGASLLEIGGVLGHRSAAVTLKYAHLQQGAAVTGHTALDARLTAALRAKP